MNKTYIKRQLILKDLGIPINKDVQEYVDHFKELIGEIDELKKEYNTYSNEEGYMYSKNDTKILFYSILYKEAKLNLSDIWTPYINKFQWLELEDCASLFIILINYFFKFEVSTIYLDYNL